MFHKGMAKTLINLASNLALPAQQLCTSVWTALGMRGSGKSNLAALVVEGLLGVKFPVIILDPVGIWFSLRLGSDGRTPSRHAVPVLGGAHGDIALLPQAGREVAEALAKSGSSAVLDISRMRKSERTRFAADFAEAFFEAKKEHPGPVLILLEEAQRFVPQVIKYMTPDLARCLSAFEEMAEIGRNYGIGMGLLSQRPQKVNNDVLLLAETVFGFRLLGVPERTTIGKWVKEKGIEGRRDVADELPSLTMGEAIVWSPALFKVYGRSKFFLKKTYDAGKTPERAVAAVKIRQLDLAKLEEAMRSVVEAAKSQDPKHLHAEIAALKKRLADAEAKIVAAPPVLVQKAGRTKLLVDPKDVTRIEAAVDKVSDVREKFIEDIKKIDNVAERERDEAFERYIASMDILADRIDEMRDEIVKTATAAGTTPIPPPAASGNGVAGHRPPAPLRTSHDERAPMTAPVWTSHERVRDRPISRPPAERPATSDGTTLSKCALRLLQVLVTRGPSTNRQIGIVSGYNHKVSTYEKGMAELHKAGLVQYRSDGLKDATPAGIAVVGQPVPLPTGRALLDHWLSDPSLDKCSKAILGAVYEGKVVTKDDITAKTGYDHKVSTFEKGIAKLRALELVGPGPNKGEVAIAEEFL